VGNSGFNLVHPEDLKRVIKAYKEGLVKGEGTVELRLRHKLEYYKWFEFKGKKYLDTKGNVKGLLIGREITERKEAERLILEENKKLLELEKMREDIITRVSHELKTPLTPILTGSELLLEKYKEQIGRDAQEIITMIERSGIRLKSLIENLLDASRIDYTTFEIIKTRENLVEIILESIQDVSFLTKTRHHTININLPETIYFEIDKTRIRQVITNILSNAIKNTPKGGEIYISAEEKVGYVDIKIKDNGVGLTNEEKRKLFEKFGKIERYGKDLDVDIEGSGLGLYISKHIVNSHKGEILVESEGRNKGALFTIRLYKT
jgi:signal transduction histidine kinase